MGKLWVQNSQAAWPGFGIQPRYETPGERWVNIRSYIVINNIGWGRLSPGKWPKRGRGATTEQLKN